MIQHIRKTQRHLLDYIVKHHAYSSLESRAEVFVSRFERFIPEGSRVLDIGGGWGFYDGPLRSRGHSLTVLDVVKPGLQKCPVVIYKGEEFPFPDKSFDVSLFITVLHHIRDFEKVLKEALRVTKKRLIIVEDVYHHRPGRFWTVLRDQIYNIEFFGHPKNFKTKEEWLSCFSRLGLISAHYEQLDTVLAGLKILNGIFVLDLPEESGGLGKRHGNGH